MLATDFLLTSLILVLIPGTGVLYTVSAGLFSGRVASVFAALGCTLGILPHLAASIFGLATLLHMSAMAFQFFKWLGVVYLLYLAWGMWRSSETLSPVHEKTASSMKRIAVRGFLINILNPKLSLFFLAFFPQFVAADATSPLTVMLGQGAIFMLMTFVVFVAYGLLADLFKTGVLRSPTLSSYIQRTFALVFASLAARLAMTER